MHCVIHDKNSVIPSVLQFMWEIRNLDWAKRGEVPNFPVDCYQTVNLYIVAICKKRAENILEIQKPAKTRRYIIPYEEKIDLEALVNGQNTSEHDSMRSRSHALVWRGMKTATLWVTVTYLAVQAVCC